VLKDLELSGRLAADMDPQLLQFLTEKVDSFVKWDLLRFFHENPHTTDTAQNIARYAGRNPELVRADLAALARAGILEESQLGDMTVYSLGSDPAMREMVRQLVESARERQFRLKVLYHIVRGLEA
jgi:hypothetical protein